MIYTVGKRRYMHMENELLYHGIENQAHCIYFAFICPFFKFFYLFFFQDKFVSQFSQEL